jgi:hypothetical protein
MPKHWRRLPLNRRWLEADIAKLRKALKYELDGYGPRGKIQHKITYRLWLLERLKTFERK